MNNPLGESSTLVRHIPVRTEKCLWRRAIPQTKGVSLSKTLDSIKLGVMIKTLFSFPRNLDTDTYIEILTEVLKLIVTYPASVKTPLV